VVAQW